MKPKYYQNLEKWLARFKAEKEAKEARAAARKKEQQRKRRNERAKQRRKEQERIRKEMEKVNKQFKKWDKKGLKSNDIELWKNNIEIFNDQFGYDTDLFVPNMPLNKDVEEQINNLIDKIKEDQYLNIDYFTNLYEKMQDDTPTTDKRLRNLRDLKDEFGLDSVQDVIDFIDRHERFMTSAEIRDILSSDQYQEISDYGLSKGYNQDDIDNYIMMEYQNTGYIGANLYNVVHRLLTDMANRRDNKNDDRFSQNEGYQKS